VMDPQELAADQLAQQGFHLLLAGLSVPSGGQS